MDKEVEDLLENEANKIYGRCRCCLEYSYVKDIWTEYQWEGAHEIYGEMLMETFSIAWNSTPNEKEQICDMCVSRLRDAHMFKREVLASEQLLREEADAESESIKAERLSDLDQYENTTEDVIEDPECKEEIEYEEVQYEEEFVTEEVEYEEVEFLEDEIVTGDPDRTRRQKKRPYSKAKKVNKYEDEDGTACTQADLDETPAKNTRKSQKKIQSKAMEDNKYKNEDETTQTWPAASQEDSEEEPGRIKRKSQKEIHSKEVNKYEDDDENSLSWPEEDPGDKWPQNKWKTEIPKHRDNVKAILTWSTATPFKTRDSLYICFYCGKKYSSSSDLKNHTTLHEDKSKAYNIKNVNSFSLKVDITDLKCLVCLQSVESLENLFIHLRSHGEVIHRDIKNHIIPYKFDTDELKCAICGQVYKFIIHLRDHMRNEHYRNYECKQCGDAYINRSLLTEHYKACPMRKGKDAMTRMGETFKHRDNVETILTWSNASPFKTRGTGYTCYFCDDYYPSISDLRDHTRSHTDKSKASKARNITNLSCFSLKLDITDLKCLICAKTIDSLENLMTHLNKHGKVYHRDIKNQITSYKFDTDEFKCTKCDKVFEFFKLLSNHMSEHYGNYQCDECGKAFVNMSQLSKHKKRHTVGEKFECGLCEKVFNTKIRLYEHQRCLHVYSSKTHKCWKCDLFFMDADKKADHDVESHGAEPVPYTCEICGLLCRSRRSYKLHVKNHTRKLSKRKDRKVVRRKAAGP
ncbi:hypothetical protein ABMA28_013048 [Loxostege sticticalis]|uniref:Uncharacterized protein n=1 Tax=Loxostege sticticalis TaxID=481309 RepID=A0ABD0S3Z3_LOXSC